jgi:hypothetical protein
MSRGVTFLNGLLTLKMDSFPGPRFPRSWIPLNGSRHFNFLDKSDSDARSKLKDHLLFQLRKKLWGENIEDEAKEWSNYNLPWRMIPRMT